MHVYFCFYFHYSRRWVKNDLAKKKKKKKKILLQFMSKSVLPTYGLFSVLCLIFTSRVNLPE